MIKETEPRLRFAIYIGKYLFDGQGENIVAVVKAEDGQYIPRGRYNLDGTRKDAWMECFETIRNAGTFVADWFDVFKDPDCVSASIYLNDFSLYKSARGSEILDILDMLDEMHRH